jgi:acetyl esterase/lipase
MKQILSLVAALAATGAAGAAEAEKKPTVIPDIVYGHKDGLALTYDVVKPVEPNGAGLLLMQSGGWYSQWQDPKRWVTTGKRFLDKGFTLFIVRHGSAPKYTVPEAVADVRRCVRFIRMKAKDYSVDPERLGVFGASAGGHLSLILGTTGDDGEKNAKDEVLRQSSRVAAVVALCPPTDLRGWVKEPPAQIKAIPQLKPPLTFDPKLEPDCSPVLKATQKAAPILMIHGDKDTLVPISHSKKMREALEKVKATCKLVTVEGAGHSFNEKQNETIVMPELSSWFEKHLSAKKE